MAGGRGGLARRRRVTRQAPQSHNRSQASEPPSHGTSPLPDTTWCSWPAGSRLKELAADIQAAHPVRCEVFAADLADPEAPVAILGHVEAGGGVIDILVNNAGLSGNTAIADTGVAGAGRRAAAHGDGADLPESSRGAGHA